MVYQTLPERRSAGLQPTQSLDGLSTTPDPREAEIVRLVRKARPNASVEDVLSLSRFEWPDDLGYSLWLHTAPPAEVAGMIVSTLRHLHTRTPRVRRRVFPIDAA